MFTCGKHHRSSCVLSWPVHGWSLTGGPDGPGWWWHLSGHVTCRDAPKKNVKV